VFGEICFVSAQPDKAAHAIAIGKKVLAANFVQVCSAADHHLLPRLEQTKGKRQAYRSVDPR
jgi:hypothetical protein